MFVVALLAVRGLVLIPLVAPSFIPWRRRGLIWYEHLLQIIAFAIAVGMLTYVVRYLFEQLFEQHWKWEALPFIILFAAYILFASYMTGYLVVFVGLFGIAIAIWCILLPISWLADHLARALVHAMRRAGAVRFVFIVALCVLVCGFVLDLSTS
jgi:hypothetical protein